MGQIVQFPTPLPGEDFRSVLYRYHLYTLNTDMAETNQELFGIRNNFSVFPRGLEGLFDKLPSGHLMNWSTVLENHTLLPLLMPFIPDERIQNIIHEVRFSGQSSESHVGKLVGNKYGKCISNEIQYCSSCVSEDISKYGCCYIHRDHQLAFVTNCYQHNVKLESRCIECDELLMYWPITGKCKNGHDISLPCIRQKENDLEQEISKDLQYLYANYKEIKVYQLKQRFMEYLHSKDYLEKPGGMVKRSDLIKDFINYYSKDTLSKYGLKEGHILQRSVLDQLFSDTRLVINLPLILLLIRFLAGSMEMFFTQGIPYTCELPFARGPWSCENKYCRSYHKNSIEYCTRVESKKQGLLGRFRCSICEGEYTLEWRWKWGILKSKNKQIIFQADKYKQVEAMLSSGFSLKIISKKLYCSPYFIKLVAKKQKERNQLTLFDFREVAATVEGEGACTKKQHRESLINIIKDNPGASRSEIYLKCTNPYIWLRKHDGDWLERQLPHSRSYRRFDWNEVDQELAVKINTVAKQVIASNPSNRVGRYSIMRELSIKERGRIKTYIKNLPKTNQALADCAETQEQYQIRHLPALVSQLRKHYNYKEITIESIMSYRRSYRGISDNMKSILIECLRSL